MAGRFVFSCSVSKKTQTKSCDCAYLSVTIEIKCLAVDMNLGSCGYCLRLGFHHFAIVDQGKVHLYVVPAFFFKDPLMKDTCPSCEFASPRSRYGGFIDRFAPAYRDPIHAIDHLLFLCKELVLDDQAGAADQEKPDQIPGKRAAFPEETIRVGFHNYGNYNGRKAIFKG